MPTSLLWQDDNDFQVDRPHSATRRWSRGRWRLPQPAAEPGLRHRSDRFVEGAFLVQQDHCARGLRQRWPPARTRVPRVVRRSTASRRRQPEQPWRCCRWSPTTSICLWSTTSPIRATCRWAAFQKNVENFIGNSVVQREPVSASATRPVVRGAGGPCLPDRPAVSRHDDSRAVHRDGDD